MASVEQIAPGETFTYTLTVGCSAITDLGCRGAVLNDVVPAPFVVIDAVVGAGVNTAAAPVIAGNSVTVTWTTAARRWHRRHPGRVDRHRRDHRAAARRCVVRRQRHPGAERRDDRGDELRGRRRFRRCHACRAARPGDHRDEGLHPAPRPSRSRGPRSRPPSAAPTPRTEPSTRWPSRIRSTRMRRRTRSTRSLSPGFGTVTPPAGRGSRAHDVRGLRRRGLGGSARWRPARRCDPR